MSYELSTRVHLPNQQISAPELFVYRGVSDPLFLKASESQVKTLKNRPPVSR
jgi:hypothetical protein